MTRSPSNTRLLDSRDIDRQLAELADAGLVLDLPEAPERCGNCNGRLEAVPPGAETPAYAPDPVDRDVWRCRSCGQQFWTGSHWDDVAGTLEEIDASGADGGP